MVLLFEHFLADNDKIPKQEKVNEQKLLELLNPVFFLIEKIQIFYIEIFFKQTVALNCLQSPPAPRNVGTPDSAEIPAPVKTTTERAFDNKRRNSTIFPVVYSKDFEKLFY